MPNRDEHHHQSPRAVPPVGRPRGAIWRALQADGVVWEGQVHLVGDDLDLAARMIVTHRRVVFVRGGDLVLDVPREWLRPEPVLRRDGVLDLFVAMPGGNLFDEPLRVPLRMREGHPAAGHIIAMLAPSGVRRIAPDTVSGMERARAAAPTTPFGGFWDDDADPEGLNTGDNHVLAGSDDEEWLAPAQAASSVSWPPIEPPDRIARVPSTPPPRPLTNSFPITGLLPRHRRKSPWGLVLRVGALTVLLATAAALGAGRLNLRPPGEGAEAVMTAPPTIATPSSPVETTETALLPEAPPAIAIGVGGSAAQSADAEETPAVAPAAIIAASPATIAAATGSPPAATMTVATIPTPAPTVASAQTAVTPRPAETPQPATVAADEATSSEIVVGPLRLDVETALRADTLPRYGLPPGSGEWLLLIVGVTNESDARVSVAMNEFRLFDRGTGAVAELDSGTDVIASLAGFDPARAAADTIAIDPAASEEVLLLYLLPPAASDDIALLTGETALDLAPALALGDTLGRQGGG
ncbi:MAG: hypothetical protein M3Q50_02245 [Chloroflexota bacterium]|nr:hypothetical protein [Chloroflexota bacterium]